MNSSIRERQRLRVLIVHAAYQQRGGEDIVVDSEMELLRKHGHAVETYFRHNDELNAMSSAKAAAAAFWSRRSASAVEKLLVEFRPDVVHVHNTFPLISPSILWIARRHQIPVVQTLHNFRLVCPQALMLRDSNPCNDCVGRIPWPAVRHSCYRGSLAKTAVLAATVVAHRAIGTWERAVTTYIALSEFSREQFIAGGLPGDRIRVKPNFVEIPAGTEQKRDSFLFVGRLSHEKGVQVLASAARSADLKHPLSVAGAGPLEHLVHKEPTLEALGALATAEVYSRMRRVQALIVPSICFENFPRTIAEAFGCGTPVIASRLGAMCELVSEGRTGLLFEPGNADDLAAKLKWAEANPEELKRMGRNARRHFENYWSGQVNIVQLLGIYNEAMTRETHRA